MRNVSGIVCQVYGAVWGGAEEVHSDILRLGVTGEQNVCYVFVLRQIKAS